MATNRTDSEQLIQTLKVFNWFEYVIFFSMLGSSALIGIYYGYKGKKKKATVDDYMLGGRKMPLVPVALSLVSSFVSGITLLGIPSETYLYGTQMWGVMISITIGVVILNLFYLPVTYNLQCKSLYEYLERRFDRRVRQFTSFVFALSLVTYIPVVIYVPALAFNQVTGMSLYILSPIICAVCIFYTSIGGLKAVVWTDALQGFFTMGSIIMVVIIGVHNAGGISEVIRINEEGERLELFNMDPDPFLRNTFWTTAVGSLPHWLKVVSCHPSTVQRYISLPTYKKAQQVTICMCLGIMILKTFSTITGMVIYAKYHDCDPLVTKQIKREGQILPYFIMDVAKNYYGLSGLFLSGVVSTSLSTMSTGLNTVAGTLYEDFLKSKLPWKQTDRAANLTMQTIVVVLGALTTSLVFIIDKLGPIMQVSISLHGVTTGIQMFVFTLGMFVPWANSKGAIAGMLSGLITTSWIMIGAQYYKHNGGIYYGTKVTSIENCPANLTAGLGLNSTRFGHPGYGTVVIHSDDVPDLYKISYLHYALVGFGTAMIVSCVVSLATGLQDPSELDPKLIIPQLRKFLKTKTDHPEPPSAEIYKMVPSEENGVAA